MARVSEPPGAAAPRGEGASRRALAAVAFAGHVPGLSIAARWRWVPAHRLTPALVRVNVVAVVLTLAAMAAAGLLARDGERGWAVLVAWLVGHFAWSTIFALWIVAGGACSCDRDASPPV